MWSLSHVRASAELPGGVPRPLAATLTQNLNHLSVYSHSPAGSGTLPCARRCGVNLCRTCRQDFSSVELFIELKAEGGRLSGPQREWLADLGRAGQDVRVWRPDDWPEIEAVLR